jgi:hypothetical protein
LSVKVGGVFIIIGFLVGGVSGSFISKYVSKRRCGKC